MTPVNFTPPGFIESTPIEILKLPTRTYRALLRAGIGSIERLTSHSTRRIAFIRGIGDSGMGEIQKALESRNLTLKQ